MSAANPNTQGWHQPTLGFAALTPTYELSKFGLSSDDLRAVQDAIDSGTIKKVYAQTDPQGTKLFEITSAKPTEAVVGKEISL